MKFANALSCSRLFAGLALATLASTAFAASTWTSTACTENTGTGSNFDTWGNSFSCAGTNGGPAATATAWSSTASGPAFADAELESYTGGFGVQNRSGIDTGSPQHSTDNNGATDMVAFSFASSVILNNLKLGWVSTDSDVSVLRYVGTATTLASAINGKTFPNLLTAGWELVGNYYNLTTSSSGNAINTGNLSSSWWLVSAYNAGFTSGTGATTTGNDYVKILAVSGDRAPPPPQVPEPGSLVLMGVALLGALGIRRRKGQSAQ